MILELLWLGFPVLHNAKSWDAYGYYYPGADLNEGGKLLSIVSEKHGERLELYKAHAHAVAWRHSPYNPDVHRAWEKLFESK
jgi:hypothetical protein